MIYILTRKDNDSSMCMSPFVILVCMHAPLFFSSSYCDPPCIYTYESLAIFLSMYMYTDEDGYLLLKHLLLRNSKL